MGPISSFFQFFLNTPTNLYFFLRLGIRRSTVRRICRDLSNRYLTPSQPGKLSLPLSLGEVDVITSTPKMLFDIDDKYWINRKTLTVALPNGDEFPMWDERARGVVLLFKHFRDSGISIPSNMTGVTYFRMPEEEAHGNA